MIVSTTLNRSNIDNTDSDFPLATGQGCMFIGIADILYIWYSQFGILSQLLPVT